MLLKKQCSKKLFVYIKSIIFARDNILMENGYKVYIDLNGEKGPNKLNVDLFTFLLTQKELTRLMADYRKAVTLIR